MHSFLALVDVSADGQAYGNPIQRSLNLTQSKLPQLLTLVKKIYLHRLMNRLEFMSQEILISANHTTINVIWLLLAGHILVVSGAVINILVKWRKL